MVSSIAQSLAWRHEMVNELIIFPLNGLSLGTPTPLQYLQDDDVGHLHIMYWNLFRHAARISFSDKKVLLVSMSSKSVFFMRRRRFMMHHIINLAEYLVGGRKNNSDQGNPPPLPHQFPLPHPPGNPSCASSDNSESFLLNIIHIFFF